jgi:hypothetical protein
MMPREQKISPESLAALFLERYATTVAKDQPQLITAASMPALVGVFRQLLGLFVDDADPGTIWVSSIVSHKTHEGMVQVQWEGKGGQMSPEQARQMGQQFFETAEAAESDSIVYQILHGFDSPDNEIMAVNMIATMREIREKRRIAAMVKAALEKGDDKK